MSHDQNYEVWGLGCILDWWLLLNDNNLNQTKSRKFEKVRFKL